MEFDEAVAELEELVGELEGDGDERALRALELVDVIHRTALGLITAGAGGHPVAQAVLAMYDLAPAPPDRPGGPDQPEGPVGAVTAVPMPVRRRRRDRAALRAGP